MNVSGTFTSDYKESDRHCPKCDHLMGMREWESSCGGYEDYHFKCPNCDHSYWVEGPDA